jgi:hypothetical protein
MIKIDTLLALALSGLAVTGTVPLLGSAFFAMAGRFEAAAVPLAAAAIAFGALAAALLRR